MPLSFVLSKCWRFAPEDRPDFGDLIQELLSLKIMIAHSQRDEVVREVDLPRYGQ